MCVSNYSDHIDNGPRNNYEWVYFKQIGIFFLSFNLTNALFSFLLRLRLFFFNKNEDIINTLSHLNSHKRKNNSCMHCMPMILLFVQSTISSFNFVCYDYIKNCFFPLLCLVVLFSWILRTARSLLWLNSNLAQCFSRLCLISQLNIYITVCFSLNFFPIIESSPLFLSLTL